MCRRCKANQEHAGIGIAEAGDRQRPVTLSPETAGRMRGRLLAPGHEARAGAAGDDLLRDANEGARAWNGAYFLAAGVAATAVFDFSAVFSAAAPTFAPAFSTAAPAVAVISAAPAFAFSAA